MDSNIPLSLIHKKTRESEKEKKDKQGTFNPSLVLATPTSSHLLLTPNDDQKPVGDKKEPSSSKIYMLSEINLLILKETI